MSDSEMFYDSEDSNRPSVSNDSSDSSYHDRSGRKRKLTPSRSTASTPEISSVKTPSPAKYPNLTSTPASKPRQSNGMPDTPTGRPKTTFVGQETAVHDAYKHALEDGSSEWQTKVADKRTKPSSDINKNTTEAVKVFVKGIYPDVQEGIIQIAIDTYFDSMAQKHHKERMGKVDQHKNKMVHYSRRKRKLQWRTSMISKKAGWEEAKKAKIYAVMDMTLMSSEEEVFSDDDQEKLFFKIKPLPWRSDEMNEVIKQLNQKYERYPSSRSKRQMVKRVQGDIRSTRAKPTHFKEEQEWVFTN
ncbi:uncharacterized protein LOC125662973 [Ostrea edulis]|uniref:uncharacterized protein LOC125662973 n=1 Tax=Ostrea edulis TaxID=37623 RepID=UPI0024AF1204|nr:uncharacterized protein LOC125662973 [Ostrea edulis]